MCRSRVRMLDGRSRKKHLSKPAMAWGSQYSSSRSRSTSPSGHEVSRHIGSVAMRNYHTGVELIFQILYDGRASTEAIDTLLLVRLHFFQVLDAAKDDSRKTSNSRHF